MHRFAFIFAIIVLGLTGSTIAQDIHSGRSCAIEDSGFQQFLNRVNSAPQENRSAIVDSFMAAVPAFPFIEDLVAHFIYRGNATNVTVPGDANGWNQYAFSMTKLSTTDFWYNSQVFESDARLDYKFILNGSSWILDPMNPYTVSGGFGPNSELAMPDYVQPWEIVYNPAIPHGRTESKTVYSRYRSVNYNVVIYLPPSYDAGSEFYPVVYFQDGSEYISLGSAVRVIDNLIDSLKVRQIIGVFVRPTNRNEEYAGSIRYEYRQFFAYELVPYIDTNYRTLTMPQYRAVIGDSYGGNISALISYNHAGLFGNCGLHSGAFQPNSYEAFNLIVNGESKKDSIRYYSVWGTYEGSLVQTMRRFRDSLTNQGYDFGWQERHEGHSWGLWRATIDLMLESFFPLITAVEEKIELASRIELYQNYPNPFNPSTRLSFVTSQSSLVILKVYDVLGREVAALVNEVKQPGEYTLRWDAEGMTSGVYICRLQVGEFTQSRKLLLLQ